VSAGGSQTNLGDMRAIARIYWRDGTYKTIPVQPETVTKDVCEMMIRKSKVAAYEALFTLYEKNTATGTDRVLQPQENIYGWVLKYGQSGKTHQLVCDLNTITKETILGGKSTTGAVQAHKPQAEKSTVDPVNFTKKPSYTPPQPKKEEKYETFDPYYDEHREEDDGAAVEREDLEYYYDDNDDELYPMEDDTSLKKMIEEMMKLKEQLVEEQEGITELEREEERFEYLIAKLAKQSDE